jgi:hypothetical protein
VWVLSVSTDEPTQLTVELSGAGTVRRISFPTFSTTHEVPLLGLVEESDYTASAFLANAAGFVITGGRVAFNAGEAVAPAPLRSVHVNDTTRREPGYTLYPAKGVDGPIALVEAVDDQGRLVWQFSPPAPPLPNDVWSVTALQFHDGDGTLSALVNDRSLRRFDFAHMEVEQVWAAGFEAVPGEIPVAVNERFHAEAAFVEDGSFWTLTHRDRAVDDYPVDSSDPTHLDEAAQVRTDIVVHVLAGGQTVGTWDLWNDLDRNRIGFEGNEAGDSFPDRYDWSAANAIVPLGADEFLVSLANQNAVVKYSGSEVVWILGNEAGWHEDFVDLLLEPLEEDLLWFSEQHAPAFDDEGRLWLFDNGNWDRGTPYELARDPEGTPDFSRVVAYDIDETQGTVSESFSFVEQGPPPLFASSRGNADPLSVTGNVLATYGSVPGEFVARAEDPEPGMNSMRILEIDPTDGTVVFDLELGPVTEESESGWQGDRAIHVSSFYPPDVIVTVLE